MRLGARASDRERLLTSRAVDFVSDPECREKDGKVRDPLGRLSTTSSYVEQVLRAAVCTAGLPFDALFDETIVQASHSVQAFPKGFGSDKA